MRDGAAGVHRRDTRRHRNAPRGVFQAPMGKLDMAQRSQRSDSRDAWKDNCRAPRHSDDAKSACYTRRTLENSGETCGRLDLASADAKRAYRTVGSSKASFEDVQSARRRSREEEREADATVLAVRFTAYFFDAPGRIRLRCLDACADRRALVDFDFESLRSS